MTEFINVELPKDERGNDPNDFRWHTQYVESLLGTERANQAAFNLIRLDELIRTITGPQYLIKPFFERDCIGTVFGDSDTYKSFLMLDVGLHIATGTNYYGHTVHKCPVVYIAGEGQSGLSRRVAAWLTKHRVAPDNTPFYLSTIPAQLIEDGNAQDIARTIKEICPGTPGLIVIDTLSTNIGDGDESANRDISRLLINLNVHLRTPTRACVAIVHHVGHGDKERERGAYAIRANVDFRILVRRDGDPADRKCSIHSKKTKDGPPFDPTAFKADIVTVPGVSDSEGEETTSLVLDMVYYIRPADEKKLPEKTQQCLAILKRLYAERRSNLEASNHDPEGARVEPKEWQAECEKMKVITGRSKASRKSQFCRIKRNLLDGKLIHPNGAFVFPAEAD